MREELMPIIAAYWGCEFSYQHYNGHGYIYADNVKIGARSLYYFREIDEDGSAENVKLHLRPLWSITERELMEIGKIAEVERATVNIVLGGHDAHKSVKNGSYSYGDSVFKVNEENGMTINSYYAVEIINYLRSKSFCVDQELINNDLVQWI